MPSKGIICYAYIGTPNVTIEFSVPKHSVKRTDQHVFSKDHLEVESSNLSRFKFTGRFQFTVSRGDHILTTQWVDINALTGSLDEGGTLNTMDQTPSIFIEDEESGGQGLAICYGFYDAGPGHAGLPKQHQCYVTVTREYANWMRDIAPPGSPAASQKFSKMVLPSAHDIGMNSMTTPLLMIAKAGTGVIKEVLKRELPGFLSLVNKIADGAVKRIAPDIIRALAITQKDSVKDLMKIGARYFEFRPARCHNQISKLWDGAGEELFFQHGAIPGMRYREFLSDVVEFLDEHAEEICVVQVRWDGVPGECERGSAEDRLRIVREVLEERGSGVKTGTEDDMRNRTIRELREKGKRLILVRDLHQASNYDDDASATLDGEPIVAKLRGMSENPPRGHALLFLQCQATATNIRDVIVASVLDNDVSTSPLLATKAICDAKILPLLRGETGKRLIREEGLVVLVNDFFEGGTADTAIGLCRERLG